MKSNESASQTLQEILSVYTALFKAKAFSLALQKLKTGISLFPNHTDENGNNYFQKEIIRTLLELNEEKLAYLEDNKQYSFSQTSNHLALFARHHFRQQNFSLSSLFYSRIVANNSGDKEALSQLSVINEKLVQQKDHYLKTKDVSKALQFVPSLDDRYKFYLGDYLYNSDESGVFGPNNSKSVDKYLAQDNLYHEIINCKNTLKTLENKSRLSQVGRNYEGLLLKKVSKLVDDSKEFAFVRGDLPPYTPQIPFAFITKARQDFSRNFGTIIKCVNKNRHWEEFEKLSKCCLPRFEDRLDKLVWRGATTGFLEDSGSRFAFINKFFNFNDRLFDVGFSKIVQNKRQWEKYMRSELSPQKMCDFKYILSIPGNDKDSGLNWKLASGSVVIMPKPKSHSWLAEYFLIPGIHYVQIRSDFSDLEEVLNWCAKNQDQCNRIAFNSKTYMSQFLNFQSEADLEMKVLQRFFRETQ